MTSNISTKALVAVSLLAIHCSLFISHAGAQTAVANCWQAGFGTTKLLDTYLSQEKFSGAGLSFLYTTERQPDGSQWLTTVQHELNVATADDRSSTVSELQGDYSLYVGRYHEWTAGPLTVGAGAVGTANLGFIYNTSNSNNPAQGRFSIGLMPSGRCAYRFPLLGRQWTVAYQLDLPLAGLMFSPNYGQSYYEIFSLGNYDHNLVATTFATAPNFRQQLAVDCRLRPSLQLRVGYLGDYQQSHVNHLKSHVYHHRVMIGLVRTLRILSEE